ncbi:MAG: hypothetical protein MRY75_07605 [Marivita sp.]|uniref:hypothetical protein n=1 Tax=Marivita sp. TaxID=2003365 RepID=UPI0025BE2075|nr:hypothetical protein [Marivita sp.]MCI5110406.1 hypothetical protein [Marivita sp.]
MTIDLIKQFEAVPTAYPAAPSGLSAEAAALDPDMIWARIEAYIAHRWTPRQVIWIVEGDGDWCPNLAPLEVTAEEMWNGTAWVSATVYASPYGGYRLTQAGLFRFTGTVGANAGDVPAAVFEAFKRLASYYADCDDRAGANSVSERLGDLETSVTRNPAWMARAMQNSGAADLLRPYRRA